MIHFYFKIPHEYNARLEAGIGNDRVAWFRLYDFQALFV